MTDPSPEMRKREMWRARFRLARPTASPEATERAIDSVLRDPHGKYAREIRETAILQDLESKGLDYCRGDHHSIPHRRCILR